MCPIQEKLTWRGTHNILQGQDHCKLSQALIQWWHIEFLIAGHILTNCVVLRSSPWRVTSLCPWGKTSIRLWVQRSYKHCEGWPPFFYFTPTCPAISLPPHPSFPFFHRGVLFHVTLATQWLCSALHSASILLPWRADALCLSSCHPHQKSPCGRLHQTPV